MIKSTFWKLCLCPFFLVIIMTSLNAQEKTQKDFTFNIIPQIDFSMLQLERNAFMLSSSGNFQFKYQKEEGANIKGPDVIAGSFSYGQDFFSNDYSIMGQKRFHKLGFFCKVITGKNTLLLKVDDRGAKPFENYKNFEGLCFYARKIIDNDSTQLDIGGGLGATDTGIVFASLDIFIVPLPMIHFSYKNQFINAEMEWIGMPDAIITFFPQSMFRIHSSFALAGFDLPKDVMADLALCCYPFRGSFLKDLACLSLGATHEVKKLRVNTENSIKYDYFTAYGQLSVTAFTIRGGYAFGWRQTFRGKDSKTTKDYDGGFFATVQAMYKF